MIGGIKERSVSNSKPTEPSAPRVTGFPKAEHRSKKSAFLQRRQASTEASSSSAEPPALSTDADGKFGGANDARLPVSGEEGMMDQISRENARRVAGMTEDEVAEERRAILERFGPDIVEKLRKSRESRLSQSATPPEGEHGLSAKNVAGLHKDKR